MMRTIILSLFLILSLHGATNSGLYYGEKKDAKELKKTYYRGLDILKKLLPIIRKKSNLNKNEMYEECNESLFLAIYKDTIVEKTDSRKAKGNFINYCRGLVTNNSF